MRLAARIVFGRGGDSERHLIDGFAAPEDGFTWALGTACHMTLRVPPAKADEAGGLLLEIACNPFTALGLLPKQRLITSVNGVELCDETLRGQGTLGYVVPARALATDGTLRIELRYPQSAIPADIGAGTDTRRLGFMLREIRLHRVAPSPTADVTVLPPLVLPHDVDALDDALRASTGCNRRQLALRFESLGHNCEFGMVQRHLGAEPLGLLRFAGITLDHLLAGLPVAFAGVGEEVVVRTYPGAGGKLEFLVHDDRYNIGLHTFRTTDETTAQAVREEHTGRLHFLQRQFSRWLRSGERIFVFQRPGQMTQSQAVPLLARLQAFGPNALLYIDQSPGLPSGAVEQLGHGLFHGVLDQMAPASNVGDSDLPGWLSLCANAVRLWQHAGRR